MVQLFPQQHNLSTQDKLEILKNQTNFHSVGIISANRIFIQDKNKNKIFLSKYNNTQRSFILLAKLHMLGYKTFIISGRYISRSLNKDKNETAIFVINQFDNYNNYDLKINLLKISEELDINSFLINVNGNCEIIDRNIINSNIIITEFNWEEIATSILGHNFTYDNIEEIIQPPSKYEIKNLSEENWREL